MGWVMVFFMGFPFIVFAGFNYSLVLFGMQTFGRFYLLRTKSPESVTVNT